MIRVESEKMLMSSKASFEAVTFSATGALQTWQVPTGIKQIHVDVVASQGGNSGGKGGRVQCDLTVTPKQTLYIMVGTVPSDYTVASYNAADIRSGGTAYANRVVVAGGGGSTSGKSKAGGTGGGTSGGNGTAGYGATSYGSGGTQSTGGAGGDGTAVSNGHNQSGKEGTFGLGGAAVGCSYEGYSGAGGAGWYGGGSGAADWNKNGAYAAGGGGGSSYASSELCSNVVHTQGYRAGEGYITISMGNK